MRKLGLLCTFLGAVSALAETPDPAEQSRVLEAVRDYALNYTARLPDFMCTQVTERTYFPNANLRERPLHDAIEEQLTFAGHKESYTVTKINGSAVTNVRHGQFGGILSSGEFGTLLSHTFDPNTGTDFRWDRWATQKGRRMYVFAFRVPQPKGYALVESKRTLLAAYKGLVYADPQTGAVWRIEMQCDVPKDSEYKELDLTLDFRPTDVAGHEYVLPFHYHMHSRKVVPSDATSTLISTHVVSETTNEADYKAYRRFAADSSITFGSETNPQK
jgi:hypothetical protein